MSEATTILFAGGGTGGHLYPGVAVADALRTVMPNARPLFVCTTREIDRIILEPTGWQFIPQPIVPPHRSISGLLRFWKSWRETKDLIAKVLREHQPAAVVGLGGYAAGVAVKMAAQRGVPATLINPDVIPGQANRYLMRSAKVVCCQFDQTADHVASDQKSKLKTTGCPIRSDIRSLPNRKEAAARLMVDPSLQTLVITGASQGAQTINEALVTLLKDIKLDGWQILHLSGRDHGETVRGEYREAGLAARVVDFTPAMADVWAVADLCVSRSGASSCAELTACGVPSLLMPYPFHKDMHQKANAKVLAEAGAAVLVEDERDRQKNAAKIKPLIEPLVHDAAKRKAMAAAARTLGRPAAADAVAEVIREIVGGSN